MIARTNKETAKPTDPNDIVWVTINMTEDEAVDLRRMILVKEVRDIRPFNVLYAELNRIGM